MLKNKIGVLSDFSKVMTTVEPIGFVAESSHNASNSISTLSCSKNVLHIVSPLSKLDKELRLMIAKEKQAAFHERIKHDVLLSVFGGWEETFFTDITSFEAHVNQLKQSTNVELLNDACQRVLGQSGPAITSSSSPWVQSLIRSSQNTLSTYHLTFTVLLDCIEK